MEKRELHSVLTDFLNERLIQATASGQAEKNDFLKAKIRPVLAKGALHFQAEEFIGKQAFHKNLTAEEAVDFFENLPKIRRKAQTLVEVGLGYVKLGQSSTTLSGGEAQRVKLATELARVSTGKTIYILDEPTTGLHAADVHKLIEVLQRLVEAGNTVLVIEHNLDVIKTADYLIDLGPEGGDGGGTLVAAGTPEEVAQVPESYTGQYLKSYL